MISKINGDINLITNANIYKISRENGKHRVWYNEGKYKNADAVLVTVGFDLFNASLKEEYGYGIFENVITSAELETRFKNEKGLKTWNGRQPGRIAFIHCVGSRDEKVGYEHCSSMCCATGVKQAIEIKKRMPSVEIFMFYMDLRMHGRFYEDMYLEAQQKHHIQFIRGRLSETAENPDGSLRLKADDTLAGNPIVMNADIVVLLLGFVPTEFHRNLASGFGIKIGSDGFMSTCDAHLDTNSVDHSGIFVAGCCTGAKSLEYSLADARSASLKIHKLLMQSPVNEGLN
jgi:heterodisulfide reductase subunit A